MSPRHDDWTDDFERIEKKISVRAAVIDAGIMGSDHARVVAEDPPGAVLQWSAMRRRTARKLAETHGTQDIATDAPAVVARQDVDAALIASPDETHASCSIAATQAGKPVLCEKPLAPTSADCLKVIEADLKTGRPMIQIGFMRRFDPSHTEMKQALVEGLLGRATMMHNFHRNVAAQGRPGMPNPPAMTIAVDNR